MDVMWLVPPLLWIAMAMANMQRDLEQRGRSSWRVLYNWPTRYLRRR